MNAAQLQNTTHLEPISVYTWPSGYNRQLASSLVRQYYSYVYMYELGFGRFWHLSNKVYNRWRRVLRSVAKTAVCVCVCVHGSHTVVLHYGSTKCTHSHWWCIHPNVQIKLHTLLLQTILVDFPARSYLLLIWLHLLIELSDFQQVVCKQSITRGPPPAVFSVLVEARWGLHKVQTDQSLPLNVPAHWSNTPDVAPFP